MKENIKISNGNVEEFFNKSIEEQLFSYFYKRDVWDDEYVKMEETEKNIILYRFRKSIIYSNGYFFTKTKELGKFNYNKVEKKVKFNTFDKTGILSALAYFPRFDWLMDAYKNKLVNSSLFCDSIVRDILLGKLTNAERIVKKYLSLNKIKGVDWRIYVKFLWESNCPIGWIQGHTTNCNVAMKLMMAQNDIVPYKELNIEQKELLERRQIFNDMFTEAMALNIKINPLWSLKRMKEEHSRMTRELTKADLAQKEQNDIYGESPKFDYPCTLLSTEKDVFIEGTDMHHCVYNCYWNRIKRYTYLAFAFVAPERFTLGLTLKNNKWVYDQAYLKYDKNISEDSKAMIEKFLTDPQVEDILERLKTTFSPQLEEVVNAEGNYDVPF